jgi:hydrogenase expression/formation protein HypC
MCLGVPGKVLEITPSPLGMTMGKVSFGGVAKEVCLAYTPEVEVGDYVIVHAGFALNKLNEEEAEEVFALLREMGELDEVLQAEEVILPVPGSVTAGGAETS